MTDPEQSVVAYVLTTLVYNEREELDPDDLPPAYRRGFWDGGEIERPLTPTVEGAREATGLERPWEAVSGLMFTDRDEFSGELRFSDRELAEEWFGKRIDADDVADNPALVAVYEDDFEELSFEVARERNRPARADRPYIDAMLVEAFDTGDEEDEEGEAMLDLVEVRAPEEVEITLNDLVLTTDQEDEIGKLVKAIEHREYLAQIGLREIGKLLFVGPPGTGKTSVARALAHQLDLPFVEVKLSMITSQYLGETAKNVEKTFEVAKRLAPCILFMDEFDFVAKTRSSDEHAAIKRAVNTLLKSIDEVSLIQDEVLLIGATNHPDQLDSAAWRRFDEIVNFPKPDYGMRADILRVVTRQMDIEEFDPEGLADITEGLTGSDLRLVLREAVLDALTEERTTLTQADLVDAVAGFEERDNLKNLDMIDGDADALVAGGGESDEEADAAPTAGATDGGETGGHDHGDDDHRDHDHGEPADHDHADD